MAIVPGNTSQHSTTSSVTSLSGSHTLGTGSNAVFVLAVLQNGSPPDHVFTGATYGGVAMTLVSQIGSNDFRARAAIYRLVSPPSGVSTVIVSKSASRPLGFFVFDVQAADAANLIAEFQESNTGNSDTDATPDITIGGGGILIDVLGHRPATTTLPTGHTRIGTAIAPSNDARATGSYRLVSAGTYPVVWTFSADDHAHIVVAVNEDAGGGTAYTLTADTGAYSLTGTSATLRTGRRIAADVGALALAGTPAALRASRRLGAATGTLAFTGFTSTLRSSRVLGALGGSYSLTGQDAQLVYDPDTGAYVLVAEAGAYGVTGATAGLRTGRILPAGGGAYAVAGQVAGVLRGRRIAGETGTYTLAGQAAGIRALRRLGAQGGPFALTGLDAALVWSGQPIPATRGRVSPSDALRWRASPDDALRYRVTPQTTFLY